MALLADLVKAARTKRGWTMRTLEQKSGVDDAIIALIETKKTPDPRFSSVARICKALRIPLSKIDVPVIVAKVSQKTD